MKGGLAIYLNILWIIKIICLIKDWVFMTDMKPFRPHFRRLLRL